MAFSNDPSYEEVVAKIKKLAGSSPTPEQYLEVGRSLTDIEKKILVDNHELRWKENPTEKKILTEHVSKGIATDQGKEALEKAVDNAIRAMKSIDGQFTLISSMLSGVEQEAGEPGKLTIPFKGIHGKYSKVILASRTLAAKLATQYEALNLALGICADDKYTVDQRLQVINSEIKDISTLADQEREMANSLDGLKDDFAQYLGFFDNWAKIKEDELTRQIDALKDEIKDLNKKIADMKTSMLTIGGDAILSVIGTLAAAAACGPWAIPILIGGCIFAGIELFTLIGLAVEIEKAEKEVRDKERDKEAKEAQLEHIKESQKELDDVYSLQIGVFHRYIDLISNFWKVLSIEADTIKTWLQKGAKPETLPPQLEFYVKKSIDIYAYCQVYLLKYAHAVEAFQSELQSTS